VKELGRVFIKFLRCQCLGVGRGNRQYFVDNGGVVKTKKRVLEKKAARRARDRSQGDWMGSGSSSVVCDSRSSIPKKKNPRRLGSVQFAFDSAISVGGEEESTPHRGRPGLGDRQNEAGGF